MTIYIVGIAITLAVLILSLITISKGYGYKHSVDPLSSDSELAETEVTEAEK